MKKNSAIAISIVILFGAFISAVAQDSVDVTSIPYNFIESIDVNCITDYAHIESEVIRLGNNEKAVFTLIASPSGVNIDDFFFIYDESLLSITVDDLEYDEENDKTTIKLHVESILPGDSDFIICTMHDYLMNGEEAQVIPFSVTGLDSSEGRIVFVTNNGEKYHFSKECAGENAIITTMRDVEILGFHTPCKKCVN